MPCSCATAASSATGCTVPTSLLAHITLTSATERRVGLDGGAHRRRADAAAAVDLEPGDLGALVLREPLDASRARRGARRALTSEPDAGAGPRRGGRGRAPLTARLSDSVPPEVNTTSDGRAPSAAAIVSRDSSTTRRARAAGGVQRGGVADHGRLLGVIASIASGSIGRGRRVVEVDGVNTGTGSSLGAALSRPAPRGSSGRQAPRSATRAARSRPGRVVGRPQGPRFARVTARRTPRPRRAARRTHRRYGGSAQEPPGRQGRARRTPRSAR